jgi:membrane fusion protein, multidrug efflux system
VAALVLLGACKPKEEEKKADAAVPVEVAVVATGDVVGAYSGTATLEPEAQAMVVAKTSGVVLKLHVEEGDRVRAGTLLVELDRERPQLELNRARATLERLENDFKRSREMFSKKLLSSEDFERVRFNVEAERAAFKLAELELSYTAISAPIDGVIAKRLVKVGNLIQPNQTLFQIDDFEPLWGVLSIPEIRLATIRSGQPVSLTVDSLPGVEFVGKVARVSPVVDAASGTFRVTTEFEDQQGRLKSGMFGRFEIVFDRRSGVPTIPVEALIEEDDARAVFVVDGGVAKRRLVTVGYQNDDRIEIREGLTLGEQVVTIGRTTLREGAKVTTVKSAAAAPVAP